MVKYILILIITTTYVCTTASAYDPHPMQDFCVADFKTRLGKSIQPFPCKDPKTVKSDDFFQSGLNIAGNTHNAYRAGLTPASVFTLPGLNTLGLTLVRADLDVNGSFPPHYHQRASQLVVILEGCFEVGFVTSSAYNYTRFSKKLLPGDVFIIPVGLVHDVANCGTGKASGYAILNSQNPGTSSLGHTVFGSNPPMNTNYLAGAYQLSSKVVKALQGKNWAENI